MAPRPANIRLDDADLRLGVDGNECSSLVALSSTTSSPPRT
jgi:hypothetical protein